mgnify:CR=1 FL=1
MVSTHSRLKAAGQGVLDVLDDLFVSTHSRLKAAGYPDPFGNTGFTQFQHTAA